VTHSREADNEIPRRGGCFVGGVFKHPLNTMKKIQTITEVRRENREEPKTKKDTPPHPQHHTQKKKKKHKDTKLRRV